MTGVTSGAGNLSLLVHLRHLFCEFRAATSLVDHCLFVLVLFAIAFSAIRLGLLIPVLVCTNFL